MTDGEAREMARSLVRGSIIEDAAAQFIAQVLKEAHSSRIKPLRDRIEKLEADLAAAISALSDAAAARGRAEGALAASEMAGVVDGWRRRAEEAEGELARMAEWLDEAISELGAYYNSEYAGDHPYSIKKRDQAKAYWHEARTTLAELKGQTDE